MAFNVTTQMTLRHLLPMSMNKKLECKDRQIYSKDLQRGSLISVSSESQKNYLLINIFYMYMVKTFLKILW